MAGPLRQCGRAECRLCNPTPVKEPSDGWPEAIVGVLTIVLLAAFFFVFIPVLVR